ncbi:MAG: ArgK protein, partial [Myxococcota bacterium]
MTRDLKHVLAGLRARDKASVAQVLNWVEDRRFAAQSRVQELLDRLCREHGDGAEDEGLRIGLTGPPGVGKSSLVARLGSAYRQAGRSVA